MGQELNFTLLSEKDGKGIDLSIAVAKSLLAIATKIEGVRQTTKGNNSSGGVERKFHWI